MLVGLGDYAYLCQGDRNSRNRGLLIELFRTRTACYLFSKFLLGIANAEVILSQLSIGMCYNF